MLVALHILYVAVGFFNPPAADETDHSHFTVRSWIGSIFPVPEVRGDVF